MLYNLKSIFFKPLNPSSRLVTKVIIALAEKLIETLIDGCIVRDFYLNFLRQYKLWFSMEWQSYLHPWIWMNHIEGRWNNVYSSKLGTFIQKCSDIISRFGSILAISFTLKLGSYLWNFPLYRLWAINCPKKKAEYSRDLVSMLCPWSQCNLVYANGCMIGFGCFYSNSLSQLTLS